MTQSHWYRTAGSMTPKGVLWHCTGANNPYLSRYVQPDDDAPDREAWIARLGANRYGNDWNHKSVQAGVQAWIGKLADGSVTALQVGPWDKRTWGCGSGRWGSCNDGWIQFEICEDALTDPVYFQAAYREGVELTAYLCASFGFDPLGSVRHAGRDVPVILCHYDSNNLGLGSCHGDVYNWFNRYGKTMDDVRRDVAELLEEENMTGEEIYQKLTAYLATLPVPDWAEAELREAVEAGITDGTAPMQYIPRYQAALMAKRAKGGEQA